MRNCLTVDVEEWFHVCDTDGPLAFDRWDALTSRVVKTTRDLLDLLDASGVRGTFFVLGWIADRYPALVAEIVDAGHEVGSHGHLHRRVYELTPEGFARDLEACRAALAAAGVRDVRGYRAPEWSINDRSLWALEALARAGFTFDSSMAPMRIVGDPDYPKQPHARSTASGDVMEFPPLVDRRFGQNMPMVGWGLRMSAPSRVIRIIEDRNARGIPVALAVHPWEIRSRPPTGQAPAGQELRPLLPARRVPRAPRADPARRSVCSNERGARAVPGLHMTVRVRVAIALAAFVLLAPVRGLAAEVKLRGIAIDRRLDAEPLPADLPGLVPTIVRLSIGETAFTGPAADATLARLRAALGLYQSRQMAVVLALGSVPSADSEVESWRRFVRAVVERSRGNVVGYQIGEVRAGAAPDVNRYVYLLKLAAVQIRAIDSDALVLQGGVPASEVDWQGRVFASGAGPYVDGIALDGPAADEDEPFRSAVERMVALAGREKPSAIVLLGPIRLPADQAAATSRALDAVLRSLGTSVQVTAFAGDAAALAAALAAAARLTDLIAGDLVTLDERTTDLRILQGASNVTSIVTHRLVYSLTGLETFLVCWGAPNGAPLDVEITVANATTPMVRDPLTGASQAPARVQKGPQENRIRMALPAADHPVIVDFNFGNSSLGASVDVRREALPRIEEIVFRYQQAQAAQDAVLRNYIAHVRIEQHFHPSPADPAYNLVTENRLFSEHGDVEWEELSFELNGAKWTANRPAFPLVQPEKVLSLPLDLRLDQDYAYRLDGVDTVGGRPAFVVRFDPVDAAHALYRGTVWIDRATFVRLKVQAVETKLTGPVVSNDETQVFEPSGDIDGRPVWLLTRLIGKQIFLIGGRSVLIEREVRLSDFALNAPDFEAERRAARASNRIMYRDTDEGVRYLVKQGETRVVSNRMTTSARAFVMGAGCRSLRSTSLSRSAGSTSSTSIFSAGTFSWHCSTGASSRSATSSTPICGGASSTRVSTFSASRSS